MAEAPGSFLKCLSTAVDRAGGQCSGGGMELGEAGMSGLSTPGGDGSREGEIPHTLGVLVGLEHSPVPPWGFPHPSLLQAQELGLILMGPIRDIL